MLVPSSSSNASGGTEERTSTPGAVASGFGRSDTGVGPADENQAMASGRVLLPPRVEAAAVIAAGAFAGEPIEPKPAEAKSFSAATTGTTPAAAALSSARSTMSRRGCTSGSPMERLMTFIPSATAWSMAFAISGELPSRPKSLVGTVSAL